MCHSAVRDACTLTTKPASVRAFKLAVDHLGSLTVKAQVILVSPVMRLHALSADENQTQPLVGETRLPVGVVVGFVAIEGCPLREVNRRLIDRCQIMIVSRQELEGGWLTLWGIDQVQPPSNFFLLGFTITADPGLLSYYEVDVLPVLSVTDVRMLNYSSSEI